MKNSKVIDYLLCLFDGYQHWGRNHEKDKSDNKITVIQFYYPSTFDKLMNSLSNGIEDGGQIINITDEIIELQRSEDLITMTVQGWI